MEIGADYYPEHWDRKDWEVNAKLMEEGGFKLVRMAEFAWSRMEPKEGRYEFGWLDDAIRGLERRKIRVILGTPTAAPPPWLVTKYPETLAVDARGIRRIPGGRRHYCFNSPVYRELSRKIVTALAAHYATHPAVIGWQTDNEIGGPVCWCENCARAFRKWLEERYNTLENLNRSWGTVFWGQEYSDWDEIPLPHGDGQSPSPRLDHARFHSHSVLTYHEIQTKVLKQACPRHFVTHNMMGFYDEVDYFELGKSLDLVAWDNYPGNKWGQGKVASAAADYMRSIKHSPFMVMEQRSGLTGWLEFLNSGDAPGQLRLWTYQAVAHGADKIVYFRWRTSRFGGEQYWHGILDHHGVPGRRYAELKRVGREFAVLGERLDGAAYVSSAGVLLHSDSRWAADIQKGHPKLSFLGHAANFTKAFSFFHAGLEYYQPSDDFSHCPILIAPTLFLVDEAMAAKLTDYVQRGGTLVLTFRSGVKDAANVVVNERLPGLLRHLSGCEVEEYDCLVAGESVQVETSAPLPRKPFQASLWCDQLTLTGARAIARYRSGPFKGSPAATMHHYGKGTVIYVGFNGEQAFYNALAKWLLAKNKALSPFAPSETVEITERVKDKDRFIFILNHSGSAQKLRMPPRCHYRDLLTGQKASRSTTLSPYDVKILGPVETA